MPLKFLNKLFARKPKNNIHKTKVLYGEKEVKLKINSTSRVKSSIDYKKINLFEKQCSEKLKQSFKTYLKGDYMNLKKSSEQTQFMRHFNSFISKKLANYASKDIAHLTPIEAGNILREATEYARKQL